MRSTRARADRGAALVEAAIVLPLLALLVFGLAEFARAYNTQVTLTHAAREGVREYAVTRDFGQGEAAAENSASGLDPAQMTIAGTACDPGLPTEIRVSYPFEYDIPFFGSATKTMHATGVMRCGG